jgi:xanthine dehydrogenase YagT iron-sulfur-binding subunit
MPTLAIGSVAPPLALPRPHAGRPWVLAFCADWQPPVRDDRDGLRAQLRGLGAELVVIADSGAWSFRADDDAELRSPPTRELAAAARAFGVAGAPGAVFVLDGDDIVRFAHVATASIATTLAEALAAAGTALLAPRPAPTIGDPAPTFTRREWALTSLVAGFAFAFLRGCGSDHDHAPPAPPPRDAHPAPGVPTPNAPGDITLIVNRQEHTLHVEPRVTLLAVLRDQLGLTGTKHGCDDGSCGACTVHLDGVAVTSCLMLAVMAQRIRITTIEGLAAGATLHPVQDAFVKFDAMQCGYCTPGQIMSAVALVADGEHRSDDALRTEMAGNLCRCGAYPNIIAAIRSAQRRA